MTHSNIGKDEWVALSQERTNRPNDLRGIVYSNGERVPIWGRFLFLLVIGLVIPLLTNDDYYLRVAGNVILMTSLAAGLHVVVGYAGMLDLGFVAFYGIGAYTYAYVSSDFTGVHLPTYVSVPLATLIAALFGVILGLPSLRLFGDYIAIVTLAFGQIFVQLATTLTRVQLFGMDEPKDLTGGPNGITQLDELRMFGFEAKTVQHYYFILLGLMILVLVLVYLLNHSRIGRAWRSLREDQLASETMGMPSRYLKLQAYAVGAAIAGVSGSIFAAWQGSVFPGNFDVFTLITLYAIVVSGGLGSLPGVFVGALFIVVVPEILRDVDAARVFFYIGGVILLGVILKPRWQVPLLLLAVIILGFIIRPIAVNTWDEEAIVSVESSGGVVDEIQNWLPYPDEPRKPGNYAFAAIVVLVLVITRIKDVLIQIEKLIRLDKLTQFETWIRFALLIPTLYLMAFVVETRLVEEASITRYIFLGLVLILLMIHRPYGFLGQARVEVM